MECCHAFRQFIVIFTKTHTAQAMNNLIKFRISPRKMPIGSGGCHKLIRWLVVTNRGLPEEYGVEAAEDALIALATNPHSYDPARHGLLVYLRYSARGDLLKDLFRDVTASRALGEHPSILNAFEVFAWQTNSSWWPRGGSRDAISPACSVSRRPQDIAWKKRPRSWWGISP